MVYENSSYVLSENPDTALLTVDKALMDHRMMVHESDLPGCWETLPPRADWKLIGWDKKLPSEEKKQSYKNSK